jgi:hypothetical protein
MKRDNKKESQHMWHHAGLRFRGFSGTWVETWPDLQEIQIMRNCSHLSLIWVHHSVRSFVRFLKITRHNPHLGNPDLDKDSPGKSEPENLNNLYGCSVQMGWAVAGGLAFTSHNPRCLSRFICKIRVQQKTLRTRLTKRKSIFETVLGEIGYVPCRSCGLEALKID